MGLEPAFSRSTTAVWPLAGLAVPPPEPDDPGFAIPRGSLVISVRDRVDEATLNGTSAELAPAAVEPLDPARTEPAGQKRKWKGALAASLVFHATIALAFVTGATNDILIEGGEEAGLMLLGNAPEDQVAAGETANDADVTEVTLIPLIEVNPIETVEAHAVVEPVEALEPVEDATPQETAQDVVQPVADDVPQVVTDTLDPVPEPPAEVAAATPVPQVLTATTVTPEATDDTIPPVAETVEPETPDVVEAVPEPRPAPEKPVEKVAEARKPEPDRKPVKPAAKKQPPEKKAASEKAPARETAKVAAGSGGKNRADARRGVADGDARGKTATANKGSRNSSAGNAAVSNYPGKVAAKLRRAVRSISRSARSKASSDVHVTFVVNAGGGVGGVSVVRSSGSPELDREAVAMVRRAAPFPPIPAEAGRSSWAFTLPLGVR